MSTQNKLPPAPKNPAASLAMQEMMQTIDALRNVYVRETEALAKANTQAFFGLQEEKMAAARRYQISIENVMLHKDELKASDPQLKSRLEAVHKDFAAICEKNMQALSRMGRCVEHLGNTMRNAAKQEAARMRSFSYGKGGTLRQTDHKTVSMGISETA